MDCGAWLSMLVDQWIGKQKEGKMQKNNFYSCSFRHMYDHAANMYPQLIKNPTVRSGVQNFMAYVFSY